MNKRLAYAFNLILINIRSALIDNYMFCKYYNNLVKVITCSVIIINEMIIFYTFIFYLKLRQKISNHLFLP